MERIDKEPYKLYNQIQNYAWGTKNENAFIPKLLQIKIEKDQTYAELWIGAHPKASSKIMYQGNFISLSDLINKFPSEILGEYVVNKFGNNLPFLLKILSANHALSIQMHPNKQEAEALHKNDPNNYPDANHKPEIAIALDSLDALVGLKPLKEIIDALKTYCGFIEFYGSEYFDKVVSDPLPTDEENVKREFYKTTMNLGKDENILSQLLNNLEDEILKKEKRELNEDYFLENKKIFGNDIGLLSFFFFNLVSLKKDEGFFTEAGIPHAYLKGNIVECMANSDNVIRAGLTPKFKDVDSLLSLINMHISKPKIIHPQGREKKYSSAAEEFDLENISFKEGDKITTQTKNKVQVGLVLEGEVVLSCGEKEKKFNFIKGEAFLVPALLSEYVLTSRDNSNCIIVTVP
jgi:mannose-6-phosphate isomerase